MSEKKDVEKLLMEGYAVRIYPQGYSMYPFILPEKDMVTIEPVISDDDRKSLRRGDVVLYRRENSILVLHRIYRLNGDEMYLVGDNQAEIEGPLNIAQVRGKMVSYIHRGREVDVRNLIYRTLSGAWLGMRSVRRPISRLVHNVKMIFLKS